MTLSKTDHFDKHVRRKFTEINPNLTSSTFLDIQKDLLEEN